jgi:RHS repeat-associated protein
VRVKTVHEYDNYADDLNHKPLVARNGITALDAAFNQSNTKRGNVTKTARFLFNDQVETGSISEYSQFDVAGNLVKIIDGRGFATLFEYDDRFGEPDGNARSNTPSTELGSLSTFAYITKTTNALGQSNYEQLDYYIGRIVDEEDLNAVVSSSYFDDSLDRPTQVKIALGTSQARQSTFIYNDTVRTVRITSDLINTNDNAAVSEVLYDPLGRTVETRQYETALSYIATATEYDDFNHIVKKSNPYRQNETTLWTTHKYDGAGRILLITTPDNSKIRTDYSGNRTLVTDQASAQSISVINALDQLKESWEIRSSDPSSGTEAVTFPGRPEVVAGYRTAYDYDVQNNLVKVSQGAQQRFFMYDALSRLVRVRVPEQAANSALTFTDPVTLNPNWSTLYGYDNNGNLQSRVDARNITTTFEYDALNRLTSRSYSDQTPRANFLYDNAAFPQGAPPNFNRGFSIGRLVAATYGSSTSSTGDYFGYNEAGRVVSKIQQTNGVNYGMSTAYAVSGLTTSVTYPSGHQTSYSYDNIGRTTTFSGNLGDQVTRTYSSEMLYAPSGAMAKEKFGTAASVYNLRKYNSRHQLVEILASTTGGETSWNRGKILNQYSLQCSGPACNATDNNGNLRKQEVYIPADDQVSSSTSWYQQYDYDQLNRLKLVHEFTGTPSLDWQQEYVYDRFGNRTIHQTNTSPNIPKPNYGVNAANNRVTAPFGNVIDFDEAGNLKTDTLAGAGNRVYDAENRMISAGGGNSEYTYSADGKRVRRKVGGVETWQVFGFDGELLAEYPTNSAANTPTKEYGYRNGQLLISADVGSVLAAPLFADDFNDNSLNASNWTVYYPGLSPTVSEQSQQLQIALSPNTAGYNGVYSNLTYNLTNRMVQVETAQSVSHAGWCENFFEVELDANNYFMMQAGGGSMLFRSRVNGVNDQTIIPYDGIAHRFWRIRHDQSANLIHFETSATDSVWITRKTVTAGFSLASLRFHLLAGAWGTGNSSPGTAKYDNFKLLPSSASSVPLNVPNSGFETPVIGNGNFQYAPSGASWSFANGGGITGMNSGFTGVPSAAPQGVQVAFLQATGEVSQSISGFQASSNYVITFSAIQRTNCCNTGGQDIAVYVDNLLVGSFHPGSASYLEYSTGLFSTTTGAHTVKFVGLNLLGGDHTAFIDNIRITGSPKPGYGVQWLLADQLGTPRMVFDESGVLANVKRHDYLPFGEELISQGLRNNPNLGYAAADGVRQQFAGQDRDNETGLDYFRARYYSSAQGRFTGVDAMFFEMWKVSNPAGWNLYSYVTNNPLKFSDPFGLWKEVPCESGKGGGKCYEAEEGDKDFSGLAKLTGYSEAELEKFFAGSGISTGQVFDVSGLALIDEWNDHVMVFNPDNFIWIKGSVRRKSHFWGIGPEMTVGTGTVFQGASGPARGILSRFFRWVLRRPALAEFANGVTREALETAAADAGPAISFVTKLDKAPAVGHTLYAWEGATAEAAHQAITTGQIYAARIPKALVEQLRTAGLVTDEMTLMNGVTHRAYVFRAEASEFIVRFFK